MTNNLSYEEAMKQLEEIIQNLDNEETLEQTLNQYKKGIELYNYCSNILKKQKEKLISYKKKRNHSKILII